MYKEQPLILTTGKEYLYSVFYVPHEPPNGGKGHVVIICPPIAHERNNSYRVLVHLAKKIAIEGTAVVRFDYTGTGDSGGTFADIEVDTCIANICKVASVMQMHGKITRISLIGVRLGAIFATIASQLMERANDLILIDPVIDLKVYLKELEYIQIINRVFGLGKNETSSTKAQNSMDQHQMEVAGYSFKKSFLEDISCLNRCKMSIRPEQRVFMLFTQGKGVVTKADMFYDINSVETKVLKTKYGSFWARDNVYEVPELSEEIISFLLKS